MAAQRFNEATRNASVCSLDLTGFRGDLMNIHVNM